MSMTEQIYYLLQWMDELMIWHNSSKLLTGSLPPCHRGGGPRSPSSQQQEPSVSHWSLTTGCQWFLWVSNKQFIRNGSVWHTNFWLWKAGAGEKKKKKNGRKIWKAICSKPPSFKNRCGRISHHHDFNLIVFFFQSPSRCLQRKQRASKLFQHYALVQTS